MLVHEYVHVHISLCVSLYEMILLKSASGSPSVHIHALFIRTRAHGHIHACIHENMYTYRPDERENEYPYCLHCPSQVFIFSKQVLYVYTHTH
jgi:hypothetical protein